MHTVFVVIRPRRFPLPGRGIPILRVPGVLRRQCWLSDEITGCLVKRLPDRFDDSIVSPRILAGHRLVNSFRRRRSCREDLTRSTVTQVILREDTHWYLKLNAKSNKKIKKVNSIDELAYLTTIRWWRTNRSVNMKGHNFFFLESKRLKWEHAAERFFCHRVAENSESTRNH